MEYTEFAKYYDKFYKNKNYVKETEFLMNFLKQDESIIDIGCGTGIHASLLEQKGYKVDGLDLNKEMLDIAKTRVHSHLYLQNILDLNINKKYDVIISMFAVLNHLKNIQELETSFRNFKNILTDDGKIIIDLHNPQSSGKKIDSYDNMTRIMEWHYDKKSEIEDSKIIFEIDGKKYMNRHTFRIFTIEEVKECCKNVGLVVKKVYENYDMSKCGSSTSKNLQFLIGKVNS